MEQLATAIAAEGWSVWWDHNLSAGGRFVTEIEEELEAARVVLVVWSEASIRSMWVADEANVGLQRNSLVPVTIDPVIPKLGFRQIQSIDLNAWPAEGLPAAFDELRSALAARLDGQPQDLGAATPASPWNAEDKPWIQVRPIKAPAGDEELTDMAEALGEEITDALACFPYLLVASANAQAGRGKARYELHGALRRGGGRLRLAMRLTNTDRGAQVWGSRLERSVGEELGLDLLDDLTDHVVAAAADPFGALVRDLCADAQHKAFDTLSPYEVILRLFVYKQRISGPEHLVMRQAAERAVDSAPNDATLSAVLAYMYLEEYKHDFNRQPNPLTRALKAARRAVELDRHNAYAHYTLAEVHYFRQDLGAFHATAERAFELNTRDSESIAMLGILMGYSGDWERGMELTTRAMGLNPDHPGWYRFTTFFDQYRRGDYEAALATAERINMPVYFADPYVRCIAHAQLGHERRAAQALQEFQALWPDAENNFIEMHFDRWLFAQPELTDKVREGFAKAGLVFK